MALTKLPKNALGTGSIDASKIEDGTVAAAEITGTLPADKLASTLNLSSKTVTLPNTSVTSDMLAGSISNAKLSNSTITFNGTSKALGVSFDLIADVDWQSVVTSDTTMVASRGYFVDTSSGEINMTLPSSASIGDTIKIKDYKGTFGTNKLNIIRNGHKIQGATLNSQIGTNKASLALVYVDATRGWLFTKEYNVGIKSAPGFTAATGGTVTTSGNFKIHTFTGDGNFVLSSLGNQPLFSNPSPQYSASGPSNVDYLVVAGGGGGGPNRGGGGGAGGHRTTFPSPSCNAGAFPVALQTYPITVGAGGSTATAGSPSVFSTITSAGGGLGAASPAAGGDGGSGGGAGHSGPKAGGSGNTPPVSPSQGNDGGDAQGPSPGNGGGGGGAGGSGGDGSSPQAGNGGAGTANSITASSVTRAGGGGGGGYPNSGSGGSGGGGAGGTPGSQSNTNGTVGTANTGGGGGGGSYDNSTVGSGVAGGKGIVIIRYKFQ